MIIFFIFHVKNKRLQQHNARRTFLKKLYINQFELKSTKRVVILYLSIIRGSVARCMVVPLKSFKAYNVNNSSRHQTRPFYKVATVLFWVFSSLEISYMIFTFSTARCMKIFLVQSDEYSLKSCSSVLILCNRNLYEWSIWLKANFTIDPRLKALNSYLLLCIVYTIL
jgi:hypothetical protein